MDNELFNTQKYKILSGSVLKLIALITMLIDHTALIILKHITPAIRPILTIGSHKYSIYVFCRIIGRTAFPLYCFLLAEGYIHTKNKKKYGISLLAFALVSEIPWNLEHSGKLFYAGQNVFFTLFLGFLAIHIYETYKENLRRQIPLLFGLFIVSLVLKADYSCFGVGLILLMYALRDKGILRTFIGCCVYPNTWAVIPAFVLMNMYNGERGFIKSKATKYIFYVAYPVHILILYFINLKFFGY